MARWVKHINSSFTPLRDVINHVCASMGNGSSALPPHPKAAMVQVANGACAAQPVCSPMQRHPTHSFVGRALASGMHHMCSCPKAVGPWVGMPHNCYMHLAKMVWVLRSTIHGPGLPLPPPLLPLAPPFAAAFPHPRYCHPSRCR